ncbi:MAG: glycosyltransferase family 2 protein [bacterium]
MPAADRVTVVIPNWNGKRFLAECLGALAAQSAGCPSTTVVDNGSSDGSADFIKENFSWVNLIELRENVGFGRAVNRGILASDTEFVALLNNDAVPDPDWLEKLIDAMNENESASSCACKIVFYDNPGTIDSAGDLYSPWGMSFNRGHNEPDDGRYSKISEVFGPCAAAAIYRMSLFHTVGLFDENFFAYYEDTDLNLRALLAGNKCLYIPDARVRHRYSGSTSGRQSKLGTEEVYIHLTGVLIKSMPAPIIAKHFLSILMFHSAILFYYLVARVKRRNRLPRVPFFKFIFAALKHRPGIKRMRSISTKELQRYFCYKTFLHYLLKKPGL